MTSPGGFQYSDDSVIAKIAVEVSATDLDNLGQLTKKTEQLRVQLEAVARSEGDFVKYLQQLPEIQERATNAQKSYLDVLTKSVEMQERLRIAGGSSGPAAASAGGGVGQPDPFSGTTAGMGGVPAGAPAGLQAAAAALEQGAPSSGPKSTSRRAPLTVAASAAAASFTANTGHGSSFAGEGLCGD